MDCRSYRSLLGVLLLALPVTAAGQEPPFERTETRTSCTSYESLRKPLFGETHAHTAYSFDALSLSTGNPPSQAYEYAKGQPIWITDAKGAPTRCAQLARPLDWAAITDHSEFFGEYTICSDSAVPGFDSQDCKNYRDDPAATANVWGEGLTTEPLQPPQVCAPGNQTCYEASPGLWGKIQEAAEAAYDRTAACRFTSFIGYEWTSMPGYNNRHRNVIFRNADVPARPLSVFDTTNDETRLWDLLSSDCVDAGTTCQVLTIPHNGNLSDGVLYTLPPGADAEYARRRSDWEPLSEIHQGKGNSECRTGVDTDDPECGFEQLEYHNLNFVDFEGMKTGTAQSDDTPWAPNAFLRNVLKDGLVEEERLGANPFKFGFAGGTDTHSALPGGTDEGNFLGIHGALNADPEGLLGQKEFNPGALTVVWAEENSRDAIFAALQRRETYATSGTRPTVRFFAGWDLPATEEMCNGNFAQQGYDNGVPMGWDLPANPGSAAAPRFAVLAMMDPGSQAPKPLPPDNCAVYKPGTKLQRIEVVKGWVDAAGATHERVVTVAGSVAVNPLATVDPVSCNPQGPGEESLCEVWTDDDFDPEERAFYYARVLENPSCRWSTYTCIEAGLNPFSSTDCEAHLDQFSKKPPATGAPSLYDLFSICCNMVDGPVVAPTEISKVVQQRAWTSPIWYVPPPAAP